METHRSTVFTDGANARIRHDEIRVQLGQEIGNMGNHRVDASDAAMATIPVIGVAANRRIL